jgi:hypothetical protein
MKVIDSLWSTTKDGCIGIIIIEEDVTGDRKAYMGIGQGHSQDDDTQGILAWGTSFSISFAERILYFLKKEEKTSQAKEEFRVRPHGRLPGKQMVEYWRSGEFIAGVYPHEDGIRVVSKFLVGVEPQPAFPPAVVIKLK